MAPLKIKKNTFGVLPRLGTDLFMDSLTFHFLADNTQILTV